MENKNLYCLIEKLKDKTISEDEISLLKSYFNEDPNEEVNTFFDTIWNDNSPSADRFDSEKNYSKIVTNLSTGANAPLINRRSKKLAMRVMSYAAFFFAVVSIFLFYNYLQNKPVIKSNEYVVVEVPYGSKSTITLPDGSKVTLNSGSYIKYPVSFGKENRQVEFEGEAFFDITKNKKAPFYVKTSDVNIKVLGTTFNVKAYPEDKNVVTTLVTGSIEIFKGKTEEQKSEHIYLKPNEKISIPKNTIENEKTELKEQVEKPLPVSDIVANTTPVVETNINTTNYTAWKDNLLVFDNETFQDLMIKLERWYNVKVIIHAPELNESRYSGKFEKETLQQSLNALSMIAPIRYTIEKDKVDIYKTP